MSRERTCQGTYSSLTAASSSDDLGGGQGWKPAIGPVQSIRRGKRGSEHIKVSRPRLIESLIYPAARSNLAYKQISIGSVLKKV